MLDQLLLFATCALLQPVKPVPRSPRCAYGLPPCKSRLPPFSCAPPSCCCSSFLCYWTRESPHPRPPFSISWTQPAAGILLDRFCFFLLLGRVVLDRTKLLLHLLSQSIKAVGPLRSGHVLLLLKPIMPLLNVCILDAASWTKAVTPPFALWAVCFFFPAS
ncbi:hypothetical protein LR48_Vigan205s000700 [Vigna angularis]|uniref:Secreted protein n=2 Tax=Phaseolus angularis TaxID=3914 RepID=A0A0L9T5J1_PHAAN|nr:hypothetical protein LR48_Vigan205s000700 [Vigna angularis]BAT74084.1 hypothetical protein VIGAN_01168100 [Vigna angularis var. angularis]